MKKTRIKSLDAPGKVKIKYRAFEEEDLTTAYDGFFV